MTQNQIAYATNVETNRHNVKQEELYSEELRIKQQLANTDETYKQTLLDIQKRYNDTYLEMQKAQGDRKLDLQQQLNMIEQEKANTDRYYKQEMAVLESSKVDISSAQQKAQENYYNRLTELGYTQQEIDRMRAMIEDKRVEYQRTQFLEDNRLRELSIANQMRAWNQQYTVDWLKADTELKKYDQEQLRLQLEREKLELDQKRLEYQKTATAIEAAQHTVDRVWNPLKIFSSLGGKR